MKQRNHERVFCNAQCRQSYKVTPHPRTVLDSGQRTPWYVWHMSHERCPTCRKDIKGGIILHLSRVNHD
jgi:hypothetical protein